MTKWTSKRIYGLAAIMLVAAILLIVLLGFNLRSSWRWEVFQTYVRGVVKPVGSIPTAVQVVTEESQIPINVLPTATLTGTSPMLTETPIVIETALPTLTSTPIPQRVILSSPKYEKQDINNCGPATLALYLRYYGWEGDQFTISDLIKPIPQDRNVNVEELDHYVRNYAGWLQINYRVGGDVELLKELIAAGIPVMIEESFKFDESYWPNDDKWAGHYFLVNGYDDQLDAFLGQDSYYGPDRWVDYDDLNKQWQAFNYVYVIINLPSQEETVKNILADQWDRDANREYALEKSRLESETDPANVFTWFNLGTNLTYFGEYREATRAFDRAREIDWPQRMLRYQFTPFMAYFHSLRTEDLMVLVEYALDRTPNSEEALLWKGWGMYRAGNKQEALSLFLEALEAHPGYEDATYAINYVNEN